MPVILNVEKFEDIIEELKPLLEENWKEVAKYQDKILLDPDYEKYQAMSDQDMLHMVITRQNGVIVGYHISFIIPHMHYKQHLFAFNDIIYLCPRLRKNDVAFRMLKYAEKSLKKLGVSVLTIQMSVEIPFDKLCESLGYRYAERLYAKYIGE